MAEYVGSRPRGGSHGIRSRLLPPLSPHPDSAAMINRAVDAMLVASASTIDTGIKTPQNLGYGVGAVYDDPTIKVEDLPARFRDPFQTLGAVGTVYFGGILRDLDEYNPEVADERWIDVADKMYRSAVPYAVTRCIILPLIRGQWIVRPGSESQRDKDIAQALSDNLFDGQSVTWRSELQTIMLWMLKYGHCLLEKVWVRNDDGSVKLARLAPRLPRTLWRFFIDPETDELDRIQQRVWTPDPTGVTGTWRFPVIPASKCLLFTYDREGNYVKGVSLYRHLYEDWFYSKQMKAINAVSIERGGMGIPWFEEPAGAQESDRVYARNVLKQIHVHEQMFGTSPAGWKFQFQETHGGKDAMASIEYHDRQAFLGALATFATDQGGSYAKSSDLSSFFTEGLYAFAAQIGEIFDRFLIREWVDFNVDGTDDPDFRYPTLQIKGLDRRQVGTWLRGIAQLVQVGAIHMDDDTENSLRDWFDFPQMPSPPSPGPGGDVTVDTESQGPVADVPTTQAEQMQEPQQGTAPVTAPGAVAQPAAALDSGGDDSLSDAFEIAVAELLAERPDGVAPSVWAEIIAEQAKSLRVELAR